MPGSKEKSSEDDDFAPTLPCIAAGTWGEKDNHLSNEGQFTEMDFGWLCTKSAQCSKIQIASERQALVLGKIDVFVIFRTFILIQVSVFLSEKEQDHYFVFFRKKGKSEKGLL